MIHSLDNSSQPYLFKKNNNILMLYCYSDTLMTRYFGSDSYSFKPWKIMGINLSSHETFAVPRPSSHNGYGEIIIECNPHLSVDSNGDGKLYYTAGFVTNEQSPISYYICSMNISNLDFSTLTNFSILYPSFTGIEVTENEYIYANKYDFRPKERLTRINTSNNNKITYDIAFDEIFRLVPLYGNSTYFIVTGKINNIDISYLLDKNFMPIKTINNNNNENIYKCSILQSDNLLAHTHKGNIDTEHRSIIIEDKEFYL